MPKGKKVPHEILMEMRGTKKSPLIRRERAEIVDDYGDDEIFDKTNPKSVYNMVPPSVRRRIDEIPDELWLLGTKELEKKYEDISPIDMKLRQSFWLEYDKAHQLNTAVRINNVIRGICSRTLFTTSIAARPHRLRYILEPPEDYKVVMQELLQIGMDEVRDILKAPLMTVDLKGNEVTDAKIAAVKLKAVEMLYNRLQGMPIHRSMQITQNTNFNHNTSGEGKGGVPDFSQVKDLEELEKIVQRLEGGSQVLDVTPVGGSKDGNKGGPHG